MANSIIEIVRDMQNEIRDTDLQPGRAAELLTRLSAIFGNCNDRVRETDMAYNKKLLECYEKETKANRAKIVATTSQEYADRQEARDTKELVVELIRSLKYFLRAKEEEYKHSGNQ